MASEHERLFTDHARDVLTFAGEEARTLNDNRMGTEHLLLGLLREGDGLPAHVLTRMGVQLPEARSTVERILGHGKTAVIRDLDWSPRVRKVIDLSVEEARRFNHHCVGTEHLLLGIIRECQAIPVGEGNGIAAGVLETLGLRLRAVHDEVMRAMGVDVSGNNESSEP